MSNFFHILCYVFYVKYFSYFMLRILCFFVTLHFGYLLNKYNIKNENGKNKQSLFNSRIQQS